MESWTHQTNAIMGISTLRGVLSTYVGSDAASNTSSPSSGLPTAQSETAFTIAVHTLSLRNLAKLFQRLPVEVVEEEVEGCRSVLKKGLNHWNVETRQQAVAVLVAANAKVKDPKSLFKILQPMERAQEDLLMYYMSIPR
ncbi:hypothetical protein CBS101457_005976 [Exobasidium rhododendri]|nr:hypothetical protein CBS101457_005976 [Exobasidium rhododendri]